MAVDKKALLREAKRIAQENNANTLSRAQFKSKSGISLWQVYKHFDSFNDFVEAADLIPHTEKERIDDAELFREMKDVFVKFGGICTRTKFDKLCKYSADTYKKRFGKWNDILFEFRAWLDNSGESFPFLSQLPNTNTSNKARGSFSPEESEAKPTAWDSIGTMTYGSFLNFRGLQHAPVNEQGVVFLFGMVCSELGFAVEAVRTSYPDCEAKRRVKTRRGIVWERVRIEFEYCSKDFDHNPNGCDVIVCWEHNWPDCPLEVIELKTAIQRLSK